jgi:60 kDa SS-A/Ro ribonucleoprotein
MATKYGKHVGNKVTPQSEPIPGSKQVKNSAGGFSFQVDDWSRLDRFLILGAEGGSYYASEKKLVKENAGVVERCLKLDGLRVVRRVVEVSDEGRAPKNDPAILALAMAAKLGSDLATRQAAHAALPKVCRIGTHLHHFAEYVQAFGGWGRGTRSAVADWYNKRTPEQLAHQLVKYQSRDGWSNRDLLRLSHPKAASPGHAALYRWAVKGFAGLDAYKAEFPTGHEEAVAVATRLVEGMRKAADASADPKAVAKIVKEYKLPREAVPTEALTAPVWEVLLPDLGLTALIRNLATMTRLDVLKPLSSATKYVIDKLGDAETLKKARIHPVQVLAALKTYESGHSARGSSSWKPVSQIVDALDSAFYATFKTIVPTGKRTLLAMDISGSMDGGEIAGVPGLTPRVGSAAMAMVTAATEPQYHFIGFTSTRGKGAADGITEINISAKDKLDKVCRTMQALPMGGTDCAQPMLWALEKGIEVDTFCVYTDNETWAGKMHPPQALQQYRQKTGIAAKLVVVGMLANDFTIADPNDAGMMDVVGFDTSAPAVIADFART